MRTGVRRGEDGTLKEEREQIERAIHQAAASRTGEGGAEALRG